MRIISKIEPGIVQASAVAILAQLQYAALRYHKSSNNQRAVYSDHANL